ncbi:MAG TPA: hypothetical protein VKV04_12340 [Verrucomicrobiae bacterium]|nr:hypothetical protein [Verrucomicrobiae bacterium]
MTECPKCKSQKVAIGHFATRGHSNRAAVSFVPGELKWHQFSLDAGAELDSEAFACPDCGTVWTTVEYPETLRQELDRLTKEK